LATLANRRAQAVKEWFAGKGGVPGERVFIVAPKLTAAGIADAGAPTRVDFAIR
jgi:outer membrane protein OmpA-like peptidoglycan-associated protein